MGAKRPLKGTSKLNRRTDKQTHGRTFQLIESIGPEGRCFENLALKKLIEENSTKEKTKHILFKELKISEYLQQNHSSQTSKFIFSIRSQTFDLKVWQEWKYTDNACVVCNLSEETMEHFMSCQEYERCPQENNWKNFLDNNPYQQVAIAKVARKRMKYR